MGLFDKIKGAPEAKMTKEEAFAGVALAAIAADGVITQEEANQMIVSMFRMKLYEGMNDRKFNEILTNDVNVLKKEGLDALLAKAKEALPSDLRETAFAVATDLALADGKIANQEKEILEKIAKAMEIPEEKAVNIIEVMLIKNKG
ncbi:MAG: tellurite resistance TerB family protein [Methanomassiliicoccales archaeon]|nr:MAG: tellurite resistance TerB family protein [Methanomassiliicoccales archaeon]